MTADTQHPWDIYAKQLSSRGYGYPLWQPDPSSTVVREVEIGDVGWVYKGGFFQLFNARIELPWRQIHRDVPQNFVSFKPGSLIIAGPQRSTIADPPIWGETVEVCDVSGSAQIDTSSGGSTLTSVGGSFSFKCTDNQGMLLMFSPAAYSTEIVSKVRIMDYMRENVEHWVEFSNKLGFGLKEHDIMFVSGTTKTARWAVVAFQGNCKERQGTVTANLGSVASLNISVSVSSESLPNTHCKVGPNRPTAGSGVLRPGGVPNDHRIAATMEEEPNDQCIFIHYYQMKRRLGFRTLKAAAGPHEVPPRAPDESELRAIPDDDPNNDRWDFEHTTEPTGASYNPVMHLLDYILETSDASTVIASTQDVFALFKVLKTLPSDIPRALRSMKPVVEVDRDGIGTIDTQIDFDMGIATNDTENTHWSRTIEPHNMSPALSSSLSLQEEQSSLSQPPSVREIISHSGDGSMRVLATTESALLSQLPLRSRIISPSATAFIKHSDGNWWNWSNNQFTGSTLQVNHAISPGSKAYYPNEWQECYVKHPDGRWLNLNTRPAAGHSGAATSIGRIQVIPQETYRNGLVPVNDNVVHLNVLLSSVARANVEGNNLQAFAGELVVRKTISIRFGFSGIASSKYKVRKRNLRRGGLPLTRGQLAEIVAEEVGRAMAALTQINMPIARSADGSPVALEDLILIDVRRVSKGALQPTIAVRRA